MRILWGKNGDLDKNGWQNTYEHNNNTSSYSVGSGCGIVKMFVMSFLYFPYYFVGQISSALCENSRRVIHPYEGREESYSLLLFVFSTKLGFKNITLFKTKLPSTRIVSENREKASLACRSLMYFLHANRNNQRMGEVLPSFPTLSQGQDRHIQTKHTGSSRILLSVEGWKYSYFQQSDDQIIRGCYIPVESINLIFFAYGEEGTSVRN
jgi:hypothetical protein